jgi:hypothetical protein
MQRNLIIIHRIADNDKFRSTVNIRCFALREWQLQRIVHF